MTTLTHRVGLGRNLTAAEVDANFDALDAAKQNVLTPGANISIVGNTISASGTGGSTPLVNDLVTGGTGSALTAQQGVVLKGLVDGLTTSVATKVASIAAGTNITIGGTSTNPIINSTGVATFATLGDRASADLPGINSPLNTALAGKASLGAVVEVLAGATYTVVAGDKGKHKVCTSASGCTITVPASLGADFQCSFGKIAATGTLTFVAGSGVTLINESGSLTLSAANSIASIMPANVADTYNLLGSFGTSTTGTVTSVNLTPPTTGITVSGGPVTTSGSITLALADDLAAVEALSAVGIVRRTAANTWSAGTAVNLAAEVTGLLPVANGGTGTASPGLVAGTNVTVTGTWPNQTVNASTGASAVTTEDVTGTTYTFAAADIGKVKRFTNASGCSATIPSGLGAGWNCMWERSSTAGSLTFVASSTTIVASNGSGSLVASVGKAGSIIPEATDVYQLAGQLGTTGSGDSIKASAESFTGAKTFGAAGNVGKLIVAGNTSGTTIIAAAAVAGSTTATLPGVTTTLSGLAVEQNYTKAQAVTEVALTDAATVAIDASLSNTFYLLMTSGVGGTRALGAPSNAKSGQHLQIVVKQDGTGSRLLTYNAAFKHEGGTAPVLSTGANAIDVLSYTYNSTNSIWIGGLAVKGAA